MRRINVEKSKVINQENAGAWSDTQLDENGFLKIIEGYFSNSADFKAYGFARLYSVKENERPFYGVERGSYCGSHYAYFIPASEAVFEGE